MGEWDDSAEKVEHVFSKRLLPAYRRQMRFFGQLRGDGDYNFEVSTGKLSFSNGRTYAAQVLGMAMPDGAWKWAWADEDVLAPEAKAASQPLAEWGKERGIAHFREPLCSVEGLACGGHTLAVVAASVLGPHPYFVCASPSGIAAYVLITEERFEDDLASLPQQEVWETIQDMFGGYATTDRFLAMEDALVAAGYEVEKTPTEFVGRRADEVPLRVPLSVLA